MTGAEELGSVDAVTTLARWLDDQPVPSATVRHAVLDVIAQWDAQMTSIAVQLRDEGASLDAVAAKVSAMRGDQALPRVVRMPQIERTRAHAYLIAAVAGLVEEVSARQDDHVSLERMFGLRSGHGGGLAGATDIGIDLNDLMRLRAGDHVVRQIAKGDGNELEHARLLVQLLIDWFPLLAPVVLAQFGAKGAAFHELFAGSLVDAGPAVHALLLTSFVIGLTETKPDPAELRQFRQQLASGLVDLELLELFVRGDRQRVLDLLPPRRQKLIAAGVSARLSA